MQLVQKYLCSFRGSDSYFIMFCIHAAGEKRAGRPLHLTPAWPQLSVRERGNRRNSTQHERASVLHKPVFKHSGVRVLHAAIARWHARSCTQLTQTLARPRAYMRACIFPLWNARYRTLAQERALSNTHTHVRPARLNCVLARAHNHERSSARMVARSSFEISFSNLSPLSLSL